MKIETVGIVGAGTMGNGIAQIAAVAGLKTIMISGMVDEADMHKLPDKTDRFISKPFKVSNLIQTLNDKVILSGHHMPKPDIILCLTEQTTELPQEPEWPGGSRSASGRRCDARASCGARDARPRTQRPLESRRHLVRHLARRALARDDQHVGPAERRAHCGHRRRVDGDPGRHRRRR